MVLGERLSRPNRTTECGNLATMLMSSIGDGGSQVKLSVNGYRSAVIDAALSTYGVRLQPVRHKNNAETRLWHSLNCYDN